MSEVAVTVKLHEALSKKTKDNLFIAEKQKVLVEEGTTIHDLLEHFDLAKDFVGLIIINGKQAAEQDLLHHHDFIELFPPLSGG